MFNDSFKYYKAKWPVPDFENVVDLEMSTATLRELQLSDDFAAVELPPGLQPIHTWRCFTLPQRPGLIVVRNPFTTQGQRYWIARSLRDYPRNPNKVNLNAHLFAPAVLEDWWRELHKCNDKDEARRMKIAMRWATLGYHHDWDTKVYNEEMRTPFPSDLGSMCNFFAEVLGFEQFAAQAAIVNYYPIGTTLAGHTDHSEVNLIAPLFSLSFGQTAIFLIGGQSKEEKPTALFLRSGDLLVMSRESRLCYHAVPRVMKAREEIWNNLITPQDLNSICYSNPPKKFKAALENVPSAWEMDTALYQKVRDELYWAPFKTYLNDARININVRQVLTAGVTTLDVASGTDLVKQPRRNSSAKV